MFRPLWLAPLPIVGACAPSLTCGDGTREADGQCVAVAQPGDTSQGNDSAADSAVDSAPDSAADSDSNSISDSSPDSGGDTGPAVVEVYLLSGQSNMDGYSVLTGLPPSLRDGQADVPLYWSGWGELRPLQPASYGGAAYTGPEVTFGRTMADAGHPVALVKHAVGGTDLATYWAPGVDDADPSAGQGWHDLVDTIAAASAALDATGRPWRWAGLVWMQGESDASYAPWADAYETNLTHFVARVREETGTPDLPVAIGLIAGSSWPYLDIVRTAEANFVAADPHAWSVETADLTHNPYDAAHYDGPSERVLGERFADAVLGLPLAPPPKAALALTSWSTSYDGDYTVGWRFTTSAPLTVTDIGAFATSYLGTSVEWGLWDEATGALVQSGSVPGYFEAPTSYRDGFWYDAVEPFDLPAGDYVLGLVSWSSDANVYCYDATGTAADAVSYVEARYTPGAWLTYPAVAVTGGGWSFLGPGFLYVDGA